MTEKPEIPRAAPVSACTNALRIWAFNAANVVGPLVRAALRPKAEQDPTEMRGALMTAPGQKQKSGSA